MRNDAIIAIVYKRQGFSRKCRSCGSDVVRGFDDIYLGEFKLAFIIRSVSDILRPK